MALGNVLCPRIAIVRADSYAKPDVGPILASGGGGGTVGLPPGGLIFQPAPRRYAPDMDPEDLLEAIDELRPQAQFVLLISITNHLREAVDEGHC